MSAAMPLVAACSTESPKTVDPCANAADHAFVAAGSADLGLGIQFTPVTNGQVADVVLGPQTFRMFTVNVRVRDLDVSPAPKLGGISAFAFDQSGKPISMNYGCRAHTFLERADGWLYADGVYNLPLNFDAVAQIDGETVTLQVEVRDDQGHQATDMRTVVAHLSP